MLFLITTFSTWESGILFFLKLLDFFLLNFFKLILILWSYDSNCIVFSFKRKKILHPPDFDYACNSCSNGRKKVFSSSFNRVWKSKLYFRVWILSYRKFTYFEVWNIQFFWMRQIEAGLHTHMNDFISLKFYDSFQIFSKANFFRHLSEMLLIIFTAHYFFFSICKI